MNKPYTKYFLLHMLAELLLNVEKLVLLIGVINLKRSNMNIKQMKEVVKQLKGASRMHAAQAAKIEKMIKKMGNGSKKN